MKYNAKFFASQVSDYCGYKLSEFDQGYYDGVNGHLCANRSNFQYMRGFKIGRNALEARR